VADEITRVVCPGVQVWRCTEAIDSRFNYTFRTIGNPDGRCVEIVTSQNQMLFDRRLARKLAEAILEVCGPAEELPSDQAQAAIVEVVYDNGVVVGFKPYVTSSGSTTEDAIEWIEKVRLDAGLPAQRLPLERAHG
jgi:hypothetical protein